MSVKYKHDLATSILLYLTPALAALVTLYAIFVLMGWATNSLGLARIGAKFIPMAPATSLCFLLLSIALLLRQRRPDNPILRRVWQLLAVIVLLFTATLLLQFALVSFFNLPLDIEQLFVTASLSEQGFIVGRMSPLTALLFILLSIVALLSLPNCEVNRARARAAQSVAALAFALAGILVAGYWYGAPLLYGGTVTPVALPTAIGFLLISGSFLFEGENAFFSRWAMSTSVFSRFTRRIVPGTVGIVLTYGWLHMVLLEQLPPVYHVLALSLTALVSAGFIALLTVVVARQIQTAVTRAEQELRASEERYSISKGLLSPLCFPGYPMASL